MVCNFKIAHSKFILGKTSSYKMHGSRDDEDIEREGERRENENVSLHENPRVLTSSNDTGRWTFPINKLNDLVALPKRPAAGQGRNQRQYRSRRTGPPPTGRAQSRPVGGGWQAQNQLSTAASRPIAALVSRE